MEAQRYGEEEEEGEAPSADCLEWIPASVPPRMTPFGTAPD